MTPWEVASPSWIWAGLKRVGHILVGPVLALLVIAGALLLVSVGLKNLQIGGILGALLGKKKPGAKVLEAANSVPKERISADGKLIPVGQPDSKGMTQAAVVAIESPGLFSNPDTVRFTPPNADKPVEVQLPDGVKNADVEHVIVIKPGEFVVTVRDSSGVTTKTVDDLLAKYGR